MTHTHHYDTTYSATKVPKKKIKLVPQHFCGHFGRIYVSFYYRTPCDMIPIGEPGKLYIITTPDCPPNIFGENKKKIMNTPDAMNLSINDFLLLLFLINLFHNCSNTLISNCILLPPQKYGYRQTKSIIFFINSSMVPDTIGHQRNRVICWVHFSGDIW